MKSVIMILFVIGVIPFVYAEPIFNEEWKVMRNIDGEWVEVINPDIRKHYTIYLGNTPYIKYEISVTNHDSVPREMGFEQTIQLDPTYGESIPEKQTEFGTIAVMILAVAIISIIVVSAKTKVIPRF